MFMDKKEGEKRSYRGKSSQKFAQTENSIMDLLRIHAKEKRPQKESVKRHTQKNEKVL
jgi:hypothetical protein